MLSRREGGTSADPEEFSDLRARLDRVNHQLGEIASALVVIMKTMGVNVQVSKEERQRMANEKAEALVTKVREKRTVFDGLRTARDELETKLQEALQSNGMDETNAKIEEAIAMLDAFVDPKTNTSPITEGTSAAGEQPQDQP